MTARFVRAVAIASSLAAIATGCKKTPQAAVPASGVVDSQVSLQQGRLSVPHLQAYLADPKASPDVSVYTDLARVLGADPSIATFKFTGDSGAVVAQYRQAFQGAFDTFVKSQPGGLGPRAASLLKGSPLSETALGFLAFAKGASPDRERNDTQQLIAEKDGAPAYYGHLTIYADANLKNLKASSFKVGEVVRVGGVASPDNVLEIVHPGYQPLGIVPNGSYCLYLGKRNDEQDWVAFLSGSYGCPEKYSLQAIPAPGIEMAVFPASIAESDKNDIPAVARWEWSPTKKINYVGIKCGDDWCRIGPKSNAFTVNDLEPPISQPGSEPQKKLARLKGYSDYQILGEVERVNGKDTLMPTGPVGILIPTPEGASLDANKKFALAATVQLKSSPKPGGKYALMNLQANANSVELCNGSYTECNDNAMKEYTESIPTEFAGGAKKCESDWYARLAPSGGKGAYRCATYTKHHDGADPDRITARWAFYPNDEGMWIRCNAGCCQIKG